MGVTSEALNAGKQKTNGWEATIKFSPIYMPILYKSIFRAAMESRIIDHNPTIYLTTKGGGVPQEDRQALTDDLARNEFPVDD